jgi:CSLREA domain-containing protein
MIARLLGVLALLVAAVMPEAEAATIVVNSLADTLGGVNCTLRNAIIAANSNGVFGGCAAGSPGMDTIVFTIGFCPIQGCGIPLTGPLPPPTEDLTIDGGGRHPFISGEDLYRVFDLGGVTINLSNLTVTRGMVPGQTPGAAIRMTGTTLTLTNVTISDNHAANFGGGIGITSGTLIVSNSTFEGNSAVGGGAIDMTAGSLIVNGGVSFTNNTAVGGGAIAMGGTSSLQVTDCSFATNGATVRGGVLYMSDSATQATIARSTFTNNYAQGVGDFLGGGVIQTFGKVRLTASTLTGNTSLGNGGAIHALGSPVALTNVTISGNSARRSGGGIYGLNFSAEALLVLDIDNATITGNTADSDNDDNGDGGGLYVPTGTVNVRNSIIAGNFDTPMNSGAGTVHPDCSGTIAVAQFNLIGRNDGCAGVVNGVAGNQVGTVAAPIDPKLDPTGLQNNGGPTKTIALLPGSPAIDKGKNTATDAVGSPILTDQRGTGFARTIDFPRLANAAGGDGTDIGAFEFEPNVTLDIDASISATKYDPLTDGVLLLRYLFGLTGPALTAGALGGTATRMNPDAIVAYLDENLAAFDADENLCVDPLTDGLLIVRYLLGMTGPALVQGVIGGGASRNTAPLVESYLGTLVP